MNKKILTLALSICIIWTLSTSVSAKELCKSNLENTNPKINSEVLNDPLYYSDKTILSSEFFTPDGTKTEHKNIKQVDNVDKNSDNIAYVIGELPGTVRIDDSMTDDNGYQSSVDSKSGFWETIKFATVNILPYVPGIGQLYSTGQTIYDGVVAVYTDIASFDRSKTTNIYTRYTYRYFYHTGYVMDYNNSWKFEGQSTSKYLYKIQTFDAIVNGNHMSRTASYTAGNGYGPTAVNKAPNYMNKTALANIFHEKWIMQSTPYYETY